MLLELCKDLNMIYLQRWIIKARRPNCSALPRSRQTPWPSIHKLNSDSLKSLTERELQILADICHVKPNVRAILKHGTKVFKSVHDKGRKYHTIRLNMITFLKPIIRYQMTQA